MRARGRIQVLYSQGNLDSEAVIRHRQHRGKEMATMEDASSRIQVKCCHLLFVHWASAMICAGGSECPPVSHMGPECIPCEIVMIPAKYGVILVAGAEQETSDD